MIDIVRTNSANPDFGKLVHELDKDLAIRDGDDHAFFARYNKIDTIKHVVLAYKDGVSCGCGAMKEYAAGVMEIKRMYVPPRMRRNGIASLILQELEKWAKDLGYTQCILETGEKQPEALALYAGNAYKVIPNFGQYAEVESSVCFEKEV